MERNLIGELQIMHTLNIKPNFSQLARDYHMDRHTVKKYYEQGAPLSKDRNRKSKWDPFYDEILSLIEKPFVSYKAAYMFLLDKYSELPGTYDSMRNYAYCKGIRKASASKPHVLYETDPGEQIQVDWKENLVIHLKDGQEISFNVFSATLGYSRYHVFIYSPTKTEDDFIRCVIGVFRKLGGVTHSLLTDNMSAIVSINGNHRKVHSRTAQLFKDLQCSLKLCAKRTPQTKGKDENANKFINWIIPYDYQLNDEQELIRLIEVTITNNANLQANTGTGLPPAALFKKEKEYLNPVPSIVLLESYLEEHLRQKVPPTLLVSYKGHQYSTPPHCLDQFVDIYPVNGSLYIYQNKQLVAKHTISQNKINYNGEHYRQALALRLPDAENEKIEEMAVKNLKSLERLG